MGPGHHQGLGPSGAHLDRVGVEPRRGRRQRTRSVVKALEARALFPTGGRAPLPASPCLESRRTLGGTWLHPEGQGSWSRPLDHWGTQVAGADSLFEQQGRWPEQLREMLYLQLPKEGAKEAGQRRPIALLPMVYRVWAAWQKHRITDW
eukprot:1439274-Amphidinium_carterae.1